MNRNRQLRRRLPGYNQPRTISLNEMRGVSLDELREIANCLASRLHKRAVKRSRHFPHGIAQYPDGRQVLFDHSMRELWQWHPATGVECAIGHLVGADAEGEILFALSRSEWPEWQQYEAMERLRSILVTWGLIELSWAERRAKWRR